ncbi:hypothetical protein L204_103022 [Cryptococcus depauperatus]|nr:hypothetical protein L204_00232 [Cryptococcus depauperatus CBS 7855]
MLKDIIEKPLVTFVTPSPPNPPAPNSTGFPVPVHRSQRPSAFVKARKAQRDLSEGKQQAGYGKAVTDVPTVQTLTDDLGKETGWGQMREQIGKENMERIQSMSTVEREREVGELKDRFGSKVIEALRKRVEARQDVAETKLSEIAGSSASIHLDQSFDLDNSLKRSEDTSKHACQRTESQSMQEKGQNVEDLPEERADVLSEPLQERAKDKMETIDVEPVLPAGNRKARPVLPQKDDDIDLTNLKAGFFPTIEVSKLKWLQPVSTSSTDNSTRFDLQGVALTADAKVSLPTRLGLHHHGDSPDLAGYTLRDIIYLCRSTVPSQRIMMMGVLSHIILKTGKGEMSDEIRRECEEAQIIQRAIDLGVEVLAGLARGAGIIRAGVDLLFKALGGPSWAWPDDSVDVDTYQPFISTLKTTESTLKGIGSLPFEDVLPRLTELLSIPDAFLPTTIHQLILILRRAVLLSVEHCETISPIIPVIIQHHVVRKPWPSNDGSKPNIEALRLLRDITSSSRACAEDLLSQGVYETTLKFIITSIWDDGISIVKQYSQELALEVFRTYTALGRYGLSASIVTSSSEIWRRFGAWAYKHCISDAHSLTLDDNLVGAYLDLLSAWIMCAIDPHKTTPEHDITWAQVVALGWVDDALNIIKVVTEKNKRKLVLVKTLNLIVSWVEGARVNGVKGGEEEKKNILDGLRAIGVDTSLNITDSGRYDIAAWEALVRLHRWLAPVGRLLSQDALNSLNGFFLISPVASKRSVIYLQYELLRLGIQEQTTSASMWFPITLDLFSKFRIGDEPLALDLVDIILKNDWSSAESPVAEQYTLLVHPDRLQVLRPLLQYNILPDVENVVAPVRNSRLYLKASKTLRAPPSSISKDIVNLPLSPDWLFSPVNELLRSGVSHALSQVPPDWNASETEVVQAVLLLGQLQCAWPGCKEELSRSSKLFNLMKIFMLEHGQHSTALNNQEEVFRDSKVAQGMERIMSYLVTAMPDHSISCPAPLESASLPFLGVGVPFFQFYTDFLALYEAISFSDLLFTQLLLPPLAMSYPADYRKLLWSDHSTVLKGMRVKMGEVPIEDGKGLMTYFEPRERSHEVLTAYIQALSKLWVTEERNQFLFRMAAHHLAALFWEDTEESKDSARVQLLTFVLATGTEELTRRIFEWDLHKRGEQHVGDEERKRRCAIVASLIGPRGIKRIESF